MEHGGDMVPVAFHDDALQLPLPGGGFFQTVAGAEFQGADLADAVLEESHHPVLGSFDGEHAHQLGHLFIQVHFLEQQFRPFPGSQGGVHIFLHSRFSFI